MSSEHSSYQSNKIDITIANTYTPTSPDANGRSPHSIPFGSATASTDAKDIVKMEAFHVDDEMATLLGGMEDEDLYSFAELQEDITSDEQIELFIYIHFLIFTKTRSMECLDQAIQRTEGWLAVTPTDHPDHTRRSYVLDMLVARRDQFNLLSEDIVSMFLESHREPRLEGIDMQISSVNDRAVRLAENYQQSGSLEDLNKAIRMMDQATEMAGVYIQPHMLSNLGTRQLTLHLKTTLIELAT
ncbi:hypothetical protein NPX13_g4756 [Xylaria arbuscula]|uniref:Uncharacterized protein n=1 Tax=Xylaria arbuscula TaxID=114810 RepID=A0A9W8TLX5_9PEZI|nr:hypothetical protein NPX13_g4756 [Xylaria arbuscula]